ncbi:Bug family tripartite tricarboxylate transporter substrate binding protein [Variovorax saccharolyticus]|uniref:Bug family tripartite tricarboxylate transporter substrate binding protein n=1 Tax=Variovorax saccharolyticus TaxID=3053516 RepID=UPI002576725C|nr:tripartite tricarboxylate transporter substrate binding protein [Variovorax sp. J22R187]MDM0018072.1 tripartite tricarboxylate transporter substrate binding protein [Variovorax sp. J22R187]
MKRAFKWQLAGWLLAGVGWHAGAQAQAADYPRKAVTMVVPYAAGGGTDVVARSLAEQMTRLLGQPVIIDNKPGAGGILGTTAVAKAAPDGYTVLVGLTQSLLTNQFLYEKLPYDPRKELGLVTQIATAPLMLVVPAASKIQNVADLQRELRATAGGGNCGSWGAGSYPHLACAYMAQSWKTAITHVAYKGEAPMLQDLVGGQLGFTFASIVSAKPYLDGGKLRAIAITGEQRMPQFPALPTFAESGFADAEYRMSGWLALAVPHGTPKPVVARLQQAAQQAMGSPELVKRFEMLGMVPMGSTPEQFHQSYDAAWPVWEKLVKVSGAKLD